MSSDHAANLAVILSGSYTLAWLVTYVNTALGLSLQGHALPNNPPIMKKKNLY